MTDRDRIAEIIRSARMFADPLSQVGYAEADALLANGVIVQKKGKWEQTKEPLGWQDVDCVECSACHESWILDEDFDFEFCKEVWKYCPHCGAKLKEREG